MIIQLEKDISEKQIEYFERIQKMNLTNPRLIDFGISNHETFLTACKYANGAFIGSAFIKALGRMSNLEKGISDFVKGIKTEPVMAS